METILLQIIVGYGFSVLAGHLFTGWLVRTMWDRLLTRGERPEHGDLWFGQAVGCVERALYTAAIHLGKGEFIAVWLGIKVAGQWKAWNEGLLEGKVSGKDIFTLFTIGSAVSLLYGVAGGQIISTWADRQGDWRRIAALSVLLTVGTVALGVWSRVTAANPRK